MLQRYLGDLARLQRDKIDPLEHHLAEFDKTWATVNKVIRDVRGKHQLVRQKQKAYRKRTARMLVQINALLKALKLGKALMATEDDVVALERAIKQRKTRLKVQRHRRKKKAPMEVWPEPGNLHL